MWQCVPTLQPGVSIKTKQKMPVILGVAVFMAKQTLIANKNWLLSFLSGSF